MNNRTANVVVASVLVLLGAGAVAFKQNNTKKSTYIMPAHSTSSPQAAQSKSKVQATNQITYKGFDVVQKSIKVKKGTTITWTNEDNAKHDVTPDVESADFTASELFGKGETHAVTFNNVGTYAYHCSPHPYMKGTIEVTE